MTNAVKVSINTGPTLAHAAAEAGMFPSVSQARKNGWDRPIELGLFKVGKRFFEVTNGAFVKKAPEERPDLEPGFWPNWKEPSDMARAIQMPITDWKWANSVINAHIANIVKKLPKDREI